MGGAPDAPYPTPIFRDHAPAYAAAGIPVFPCVRGDKTPLTPHGFKDATTDPVILARWCDEHPDANIGAPTRDDELVIDVDPRNGGDQSLAALERLHGPLPPTQTVQTGSGGSHRRYRYSGPPVRWKKELAPGIDLKVTRGYVLLPPSYTTEAVRTHDGTVYGTGRYALVNDAPVAPVPEWVIALGTKAEATDAAPAASVEGAITANRNVTLTSLAGSMRRRGMTEAEILAALLAVNTNRCQPPLPEAEVRKIATSVASYPPEAPPVEIELVTNAKAAPIPDDCCLTTSEMLAQAPPVVDWVITGLAAQGSTTCLSAWWKVGKTELLFAALAAMQQGKPFLGFATKPGHVIYLTEDPLDAWSEKIARWQLCDTVHWIQYHKMYGKPWPVILDYALNQVMKYGAHTLVVDTYAQWMGLQGEEENNSGDVLRVVTPLKVAAEQHHFAAILPAHDRKSGGEYGTAIRGSGALPGAVDIILGMSYVSAQAQEDDGTRLLRGLGRYREIPRVLAIKLTDDGYEQIAMPAGGPTEGQINRARIKDACAFQPRTVEEIAAATQLAEPTVQRHVTKLAKEGELDPDMTKRPYKYYTVLTRGEADDSRQKAASTSDPVAAAYAEVGPGPTRSARAKKARQ